MNTDTIYLNHAGTSWPKPETVLEAAAALPRLDPIQWPSVFESAHREVAAFFHVDPARLLLTPSCTAALNIAIIDHPWQSGDRIITSHFEHHAIHRQLVKLSEYGVEIIVLPQGRNELIQLETLEAELRRGSVRLVAMTAACNVTGQMLPIRQAVELAREYGAVVLVDGAQIAGWWDLDLTGLGADLFTFAGHKGLHAPWGIGGLYVSADTIMKCPGASCDLAGRAADEKVAEMPGYCDVGSVNLAALAGLAAGCRWLSAPEQNGRLQHAREMTSELAAAIRDLPGVAIRHDVSIDRKMPTIAMTLDGISSLDLATRLRERGVIAAGGFQCAPQAHHALGTGQTGVIRFSVGPQNVESDIAAASGIVAQLAMP